MIRVVGGAYILLSVSSLALFGLLAKSASSLAETVMLGVVGTIFSSLVFVLGASLLHESIRTNA